MNDLLSEFRRPNDRKFVDRLWKGFWKRLHLIRELGHNILFRNTEKMSVSERHGYFEFGPWILIRPNNCDERYFEKCTPKRLDPRGLFEINARYLDAVDCSPLLIDCHAICEVA